MTGKRLAGFIAAFGLAMGLPGSTGAALITWVFEGRVELIEPSTGPTHQPEALLGVLTSLGVVVGAAVQGHVSFESSAVDVDPRLSGAQYEALISSELSIGSYRVSSDLLATHPTGALRSMIAVKPLVEEGWPPGLSGFFLTTDSVGDAVGLITGASVLGIQLSSPDLPFFAGATRAIPIDPPALADLDPYGFDDNTPSGYGSDIVLGFESDFGFVNIQSSFSRLERVPEPTALALLAPLAVALFAIRRR